MFSVQIDSLDPDVLRAFAKMFNELSTLDKADAVEITGRQYIDKLDSPDVGTEKIFKTPTPVLHTVGVVGCGVAGVVSGLGGGGAGGDTYSDASVIFGGSPVPKVPSNAPYTAVAEAPLIAPAGIPVTSANTVSQTPAPPPVVKVQTVAAPTPPTNRVPLDSEGMPWDARIHAGTQTQTQKGVWKARKGVDDATIAAVTAELRAVLALPPAAPFVPLNQTAITPPPVVAPPPPPPTAQVDAPNDFATLCRYVTSRQLPPARILEVCNKHGLAGLGLVALRPDLIPAIYADFASS